MASEFAKPTPKTLAMESLASMFGKKVAAETVAVVPLRRTSIAPGTIERSPTRQRDDEIASARRGIRINVDGQPNRRVTTH